MLDVRTRDWGWGLLVLGICLVVLLVARWRALSEPVILGYDESLFLAQGMAWTEGHVPCRDTWVNKPALLASVFAISDLAAPGDPRAPRILHALFLLGTALLIGWLVGRCRGALAGAVAAVACTLYASTSMNPGDHLPALAEAFFVLPFVLGIALLFVMPTNASPRRVFLTVLLSGASLGIAAQMRQNGVLALPFIAGLVAFHPALGLGLLPLRRAAAALLYCAGFLVALLPTVLVATSAGAWGETVFWTWTYPRIGHVFAPLDLLWPGAVFLFEFLKGHWILSILFAVGVCSTVVTCIATRERGERWRLAFLLACLAPSAGMTVLGGQWYQHYWVMFAPAAGLFAGLGAGEVARLVDAHTLSGHWRKLAVLGLVALSGWVVLRPTIRSARAARRFDHFMERSELAAGSPLMARIAELTQRGETIYILGPCAGIYYRARRSPAAPDLSGTLLFSPLVPPQVRGCEVPAAGGGTAPIPEVLAARMTSAALILDLTGVTERRPEFLGGQRVRWDHVGAATPDAIPAIRRVLEEKFRPLPELAEGVRLYVPRH